MAMAMEAAWHGPFLSSQARPGAPWRPLSRPWRLSTALRPCASARGAVRLTSTRALGSGGSSSSRPPARAARGAAIETRRAAASGFGFAIGSSRYTYLKYHDLHGGEQESRKSNYTDLVNKYYDLVTGFYEYGWGHSFHFAGRYPGETSHEAIKRHEHFITLQLGLKKGMKVLDVGCGIGGPLIEIARFSSALITGLNYNDYQISRGKELLFSAGLSEQCCFLKGDFMNMPIADNTFDAAYAIQATCHAPDAHGVYSEIYRVLKPGQYFALDEWCLTDRFDPSNPKHLAIKAEIELGDGLPDIRTTRQCVHAMKDAGFEVIFAKDLAQDFPCPWYQTIDPSNFSWSSFQCTRLGRIITHAIVNTLEFLRIAPAGSVGPFNLLLTAADGLLKGGRDGIFTANFFVLGRKPLKETGIVNDGNR